MNLKQISLIGCEKPVVGAEHSRPPNRREPLWGSLPSVAHRRLCADARGERGPRTQKTLDDILGDS